VVPDYSKPVQIADSGEDACPERRFLSKVAHIFQAHETSSGGLCLSR
jgi:hypothetical protein